MTEHELSMTAELSKVMPTEEAIERWVLESIRHSFHYEYFIPILGLNPSDEEERPHDLAGSGNKLEWDVLRGLAFQYTEPPVDFETYIKPAIERHQQQQYHHKIWNGDIKSPGEDDSMLIGAVDAICSKLENRRYQGGSRSYDEIEKIFNGTKKQKKYMKDVLPEMRKIEQPELRKITLSSLPNIGVPDEIYNGICNAFARAVKMLRIHAYNMSSVTL
ncbi:MAG: hypothetical protein V3U72_03695 [Candidatus Aenigmarchaeota archaeon]